MKDKLGILIRYPSNFSYDEIMKLKFKVLALRNFIDPDIRVSFEKKYIENKSPLVVGYTTEYVQNDYIKRKAHNIVKLFRTYDKWFNYGYTNAYLSESQFKDFLSQGDVETSGDYAKCKKNTSKKRRCFLFFWKKRKEVVQPVCKLRSALYPEIESKFTSYLSYVVDSISEDRFFIDVNVDGTWHYIEKNDIFKERCGLILNSIPVDYYTKIHENGLRDSEDDIDFSFIPYPNGSNFVIELKYKSGEACITMNDYIITYYSESSGSKSFEPNNPNLVDDLRVVIEKDKHKLKNNRYV